MKTRDDLTVAGLVHDLNNVLQTLVAVAAEVEDTGSPAMAAVILRSVERGLQITAGLQRGATPMTSLEQIVANARSFIEDFQIASGERTAHVEVDIEAGIELKGHWDWERVLVNLFLNSLRAMPEGGTIFVKARRKGAEIVMSVADEGSGIPVAVRKQLFEPHVSTHGSSGLGLHIVRSVVQAHGGTVRAVNRRSGGAEFVITIPAVAGKARRAHA